MNISQPRQHTNFSVGEIDRTADTAIDGRAFKDTDGPNETLRHELMLHSYYQRDS